MIYYMKNRNVVTRFLFSIWPTLAWIVGLASFAWALNTNPAETARVVVISILSVVGGLLLGLIVYLVRDNIKTRWKKYRKYTYVRPDDE